MRTFAPKQKPGRQTESPGSETRGRVASVKHDATRPTLHAPRANGNQAARRPPETDAESRESVSGAVAAARPAHDFSRIPLRSEVPAAVASGGSPLDADVRARYERGLGGSLGDIRIHDDARAAASADALDAEAYTVGRDIVFGAGRYRPRSSDGERLLAHELAHAVQQRTGTPAGSSLAVSRPGDPAEREADRAAAALVSGRPAHLAPGSEPLAIHRQPKKQLRRADRFLPNEKSQLSKLGRGELDDLIDLIIADGAYHQIRREDIGGVEHTWEVKTVIIELSEEEQMQGAQFGGALKPEETVTSPDGKQIRHQYIYALRGGRASDIRSALHELIHLRIGIDRSLPEAKRSSFFREYNQLNEMSEVTAGAKFGATAAVEQKSNYGALALASGNSAQVSVVLKKINALRSFYIGHDAAAEAKFDSEPNVTPAALVEFIAQEKYVTQTAARATSPSGSAPSNEVVATRYARLVAARFGGLISVAAQTRISSSPIGTTQEKDLIDALRLAIQRLYDALDKSLKEAEEFKKNPPAPPPGKFNQSIFETRPVGLDGQPVPLK